MRYTLRLLTLQQFQRAAALICACELLRRDRLAGDPRWGTTPFRIGLWVGRKSTPTNTAQASGVGAAHREELPGRRRRLRIADAARALPVVQHEPRAWA